MDHTLGPMVPDLDKSLFKPVGLGSVESLGFREFRESRVQGLGGLESLGS